MTPSLPGCKRTAATDVVVDRSGRPVIVDTAAIDDSLVLAPFQP